MFNIDDFETTVINHNETAFVFRVEEGDMYDVDLHIVFEQYATGGTGVNATIPLYTYTAEKETLASLIDTFVHNLRGVIENTQTTATIDMEYGEFSLQVTRHDDSFLVNAGDVTCNTDIQWYNVDKETITAMVDALVSFSGKVKNMDLAA